MDTLQLSAQRQDGTATVAVGGELDIATIDELRSFVAGVLVSGHSRFLIVDVSGLSFIGASGLGMLLMIQHLAERRQVEMRLAGASPDLLQLLKITRLEGQFTMVEC
jgi:anti-sigma B factor antagonist